MSEYLYYVGQTVRFAKVSGPSGSSLRGDTPTGLFQIVRQLPIERGVIQYRVCSAQDGHERVVTEAEVIAK